MICPECGKDLEKGSLVVHRQTQNGVAKGGSGQVGNKDGGGNEPSIYRIAFTSKSGPMPCPVEVCSIRAATRTVMRVHFWNQHVWDTVVILEEGNTLHPQ